MQSLIEKTIDTEITMAVDRIGGEQEGGGDNLTPQECFGEWNDGADRLTSDKQSETRHGLRMRY
jgi:hypothetical protein